jgi:large subunit ribosomal protein L29
MTQARELREMNDEELEHKLLESKHELFNLRFQMATGKQDNSARLRQVRRDIARVATVLREREIAAAEALSAAPATSERTGTGEPPASVETTR